MYSAELERHKKEKEEWKRKAERLEDQASALQVNDRRRPDHRRAVPPTSQLALTREFALLCSLLAQPGRGQRCSGISLPPHRPAGPAGGANGGSEETR